jgi:hypothetical protein
MGLWDYSVDAAKAGGKAAKDAWMKNPGETVQKVLDAKTAAEMVAQTKDAADAAADGNQLETSKALMGNLLLANDLAKGGILPTGELKKGLDNMADTYYGPNQDKKWDDAVNKILDINPKVADNYDQSKKQVDPLVLDLDGDGLELTAVKTFFDFNGDGVRTGTAWVGADDGILVRDLNGNGTIDNGSELFGTDTVKSDGTHATSGLDALADMDSNGDGQFTAADTDWNQVKVWRDLNQDGITEAGELFTLDELGITRIAVSGVDNGSSINGNTVEQTASFTINGQEQTAGDIGLTSAPFYRQFTDEIAVSEEAAALPWMRGSGMARDLDEAATLSPELANLLTQFTQATTRDAQMALIDSIITAWAKSSDYWATLEQELGGTVAINMDYSAGMTEAQFRNLISVLEVFNGSRFFDGGANLSGDVINGFAILPHGPQMTDLEASYAALKDSIYGALVLQTRLMPYLDGISVTLTMDGDNYVPSFDTSAMTAMLNAGWQSDLGDATYLRGEGEGFGFVSFNNRSIAAIKSEALHPSAGAILSMVVNDGWRCPRSNMEINVRSSPTSSASTSWLRPASLRFSRNTLPNASSGSKLFPPQRKDRDCNYSGLHTIVRKYKAGRSDKMGQKQEIPW